MNDSISVQVKHRNMIIQVLLTVITFGMYPIYWFYVTTKEMLWLLKRPESAFVIAVLACVPIVHAVACYLHAEMFEELTRKEYSKWLTLLLYLFFPPAAWFIIQTRLNQIARETQVH